MTRVARATIVVVCLIGGLLATAAPALAATISVDGDCSLSEAVTAANVDVVVAGCEAGTGSDTILLPADPLILISSQIDITDDLVIQGVSSAATVIDLSLVGDDGFQVDPGIEVTFRQLAIDGNGNTHEAIDNRGDLTLESVLVTGNANPNEGGAVSNQGIFASLTVTNSTFEDNHGGDLGGAIYQDGGDLTITDSIFEGNTADVAGGAVYAFDTAVVINGATEFTGNASAGTGGFDGGGALYLDGGTALIDGPIEFSTNTSLGDGGGIYMIGTELEILGADFSDNYAEWDGGALYADCTCGGGSLFIDDSVFIGNEAEGGGAAAISGDFDITGARFSGNSSGVGGALLAGPADTPLGQAVRESVFENNTATGAGGAIAVEAAELEVTDSTLHENHSTGSGFFTGGGAIFALVSTVVLERTTVSDNDALETGGGIASFLASVDVVNSTVSGNSVSDPDGLGGGIWLADSDAFLLHATITDNSAPDEGGGVWTNVPVDTEAYGSIIAGNSVGGDCSDPLEDLSVNLDSDTSCFPASTVGSITDDPQLDPLDDNGGPTETHALAPNSPAVNIADGGPCGGVGGIDQRGEDRPAGGACDLGAYELQPAPPPPPPTPKHTLTVTNSGGGTVTGEELEIDCGTECEATLDEGTTGVLTATPNDGYEFDGWEGDCVSIDEDECTVEIDDDREVTASFADLPPIPSGRCQGMEYGSSNVLRDGTRMIAGTTGDDDLQGSGRPDVICGLQGNDTLRGKSGGDILLGGSGDDELIGGKGPDRLNGGPGTDTCRGGKGKNKLIDCE